MSEVNSGAPTAPETSSSPELNLDSAVSEVENSLSALESEVGGDDAGLDSSNEIDAAEATGQITKKEAQALKKKLKLKVDGQEIEEDLDWNDEEGLKKHLQKSKAFDKRSKEHAAYKAQVDQVLQMLQSDPEALLEKMGYNLDEMSEKRLARRIEEMKKSPEEQERDQMRKELEDYKKKEKELKDRAEKAELEKFKNEAASKIETDISDALDNAKSILPKKNPAVMQRIAQAMLFAYNQGYKNVEAKDVIPFVEKQFREEYASILGTSSDDILEALAGKDRLNNYRKAQVKAKAPSVQKPVIQDTGKAKVKKEEPKAEPFSSKSFLKINPNK